MPLLPVRVHGKIGYDSLVIYCSLSPPLWRRSRTVEKELKELNYSWGSIEKVALDRQG